MLPEDVLCQAMAGCVVDRGCWRMGSAARWADGLAIALVAMRFVDGMSVRLPEVVGMVTVMCCCSPVCRAGS